MKILIVMNYRPDGGLTAAVEELVMSLKKENFSVDILPTYGKIRERIKNVLYILNKASGYNLIIASGCAYYGFLPIIIGVIAGRIYKKRILVDFHEGYPLPFFKRYGLLIKIFLGNTHVSVASQYLRGLLKKYALNPILIPYHFHHENFPRRKEPFCWNKKFLWVGIFQFMYDPETALKAAHLVLQKRNDITFHFFGEGPLLNKMKKKYGHQNIKIEGFIPRRGLLERYQDFSVLINTSFGDNFPLRLVEASFNELLVVSAKYGGTATIYGDDECLFFDKGDYKKLCEYIIDVADNSQRYDALRMKMHAKVISFTWGAVKEKWMALLEPE